MFLITTLVNLIRNCKCKQYDDCVCTEVCPAGPLHTYHGSCMSESPGRQGTGTCSGTDAVRVAYADSWTSYNGRGGATGCWFDSLLWGLRQGLLTIQQRQPQGREALLLTERERPEFVSERIKQTCTAAKTNTAVVTG